MLTRAGQRARSCVPDRVTDAPAPSRYLSPAEKAVNLAEWERAKRQPRPPGDLGELGWPDPDIIPLCDALNEFPGVCTVQSCAGHGSALAGYVQSSGHLWLRLNDRVSAAFDRSVFHLSARTDLIERVWRIYSEDGKEITCIAFAGNERGLLSQSSALIFEFFSDVIDRA